jgi:PAS domain S-box-containing protein
MLEPESKAADKSVRPTPAKGMSMVAFSWPDNANETPCEPSSAVAEPYLSPSQAEEILQDLAGVFRQHNSAVGRHVVYPPEAPDQACSDDAQLPNLEARYRALVEQIPAVVFMAYLDRGIGEAYVSPQIEASLGFSQEEWLEDPVRWYSHIHPDDKQRWSTEAAEMFLTGNPLRSSYRVVARDGRVIWFHCEAKMIRKENGEPWFIHGVGFDITDLKRTEEALQEERNVVSAILDTVRRVGHGARSGGPHHPLQPRLRTNDGIFLRRSSGKIIWDLVSGSRKKRARFKASFEQRRAPTIVPMSMRAAG